MTTELTKDGDPVFCPHGVHYLAPCGDCSTDKYGENEVLLGGSGMTTKTLIELTGLPDYMDSMEDAAWYIVQEGFATGARVVTLTEESHGLIHPDGRPDTVERRLVTEWEGVQE